MKEIDFLPEWYKNGRRRKVGYRTQFVCLGCVFGLMVLLDVLISSSISRTRHELTLLRPQLKEAKSVSEEFSKVKGELSKLEEKMGIIEDVDSRMDVSSVLGELSYVIGRNVVLSKVNLEAERFEGKSKKKSSGVRVAGSNRGVGKMPIGDVRFKITINGVASDAREVAELICRLEDSPYFFQVYPVFSRNKKGTSAGVLGQESRQVSEFEIRCYLANYRQKGEYFAKGSSG